MVTCTKLFQGARQGCSMFRSIPFLRPPLKLFPVNQCLIYGLSLEAAVNRDVPTLP